MADVVVTNNPAQSRYEARIGGDLAGFAEYARTASMITFTHTEVGDAFGGRGVGSAIARSALDDVRREGTRQVRPVCSFFAGWIDQHPDYQDLLDR